MVILFKSKNLLLTDIKPSNNYYFPFIRHEQNKNAISYCSRCTVQCGPQWEKVEERLK